MAAGPSGLLIVDLDQPKNSGDGTRIMANPRGATNGADVLALAAHDHGADLADTCTVTTPRGGRHLYFRQPTSGKLGNSAGRVGWNIDTRGHGG